MTVIDGAHVAAEARQQVDSLWREADPDTLIDRLERIRHLLRQVRQFSDDELVADAWRLFLVTLLEAERVADIDVTLGELRIYCLQDDAIASRAVLAWFRGLRAVLDGDPDQAEALLATSLPSRERLGPLTVIRCFQGRAHELEPLYLEARRDDPRPVHVIMLAWLWAHQGRIAAARGSVKTFGSLSALPRDRDWLFGLSLLADVSVLLDDKVLADEIYQTLLPYSQRIVLIGNGSGCWGSVDRPLGILARFLGRFDDAAMHFTEKIALSAAAGAHPWLARSQLDLAELLCGADTESVNRGMAGERAIDGASEAARHACEGIAAVRRLNYPALHSRADALERKLRTLGIELDVPARATSEATGDVGTGKPRVNIMGRFEVYSSQGIVTRWTSRKASQLLCLLIAHRGRSLSRESLMEHLWPGEPPARLRNRLAVAVSTVRKSLDPFGSFDPEQFVDSTRETVRIRVENVSIDAEDFLAVANSALASDDREQIDLSRALGKYRGEVFADEPYADWAAPLKDECSAMQVALLHAIIDLEKSDVRMAEFARKILDIDPYDDRANRALVESLDRLGARGLASASRERFRASLEENVSDRTPL